MSLRYFKNFYLLICLDFLVPVLVQIVFELEQNQQDLNAIIANKTFTT